MLLTIPVCGPRPSQRAGPDHYGRWTYKLEEAARRGALGAILLHTTEAADLRDGNVGARVLVGGAIQARPAAAQSIAFRRVGDARRRSGRPSRAGLNLDSLTRAAARREFRPVRPGSMSRRGHERAGVTSAREVGARSRTTRADPQGGVVHRALGSQGDRPGRQRRLDIQWCGRTNASGRRGDARRRRSTDSGAPAARRRTLLFVATTAEESGLLGSEAYTQRPPRAARADGRGDQSRT